MVILNIKRLLKEYRDLKRQVQNNEISLKEFHMECKKKYTILNAA